MHCEDIETKFDRYLEGDLRVTERLMVDVHLAQCYACRETLDTYREMNAAIQGALRHPEPRNDFNRLLARIRAAEQRTERPPRRRTMPATMKRVAIAGGVLIAIGVSLAQFDPNRPARSDEAVDSPAVIESINERNQRLITDPEAAPDAVLKRPVPAADETNAAL